MPRNPCPSCGAEIAVEKINIAEGVGLCDACGEVSRLADIADGNDQDESSVAPVVDAADDPPPGCALDDRGNEIIVRASCRSLGSAIFGLIFGTFWNGIVSIFVLIAIGGLYTNITGQPLPSWFPAPSGGSSGPGHHGTSGNLGPNMTLFLCVFLVPFVLVGVGMIIFVLVSLFGRNEVRLRGEEAVVRTAIGPVGWKRRFDASKVTQVRIGRTSWKENNRTKPVICIEAERTLRFGSSMREDRRAWMCAVLRKLLVEPARRPSLGHR